MSPGQADAGATGAATVAGVVGWPVSRSLSPRIHAAWLAAAGIDGLYAPFAVAPERFDRFVEGLRGGAVAGLNVTAPHKARAFALADVRTPAAAAAGAANLLRYDAQGGLTADNTDGAGLLAALRAADALHGPVLLIGAGGASWGAAAALAGEGVELRVANRTVERAEALAAAFGAHAFGLDRMDAAAEGARLVVNATTLGFGATGGAGGDGGGEAPPVAWARLAPGATAMDMVYAPLRTPFLRAAAAHGLSTVDGLAMLIAQARPSFAAFYGRPPPEGVDVRALCLAALGEAREPPE